MEQDDAQVAVDDLLEAGRERFDLGGRLRVQLAEQRLAEVRQRRAGEAADEALRPGDADRHAVDGGDRPGALEHDHARALEDAVELADGSSLGDVRRLVAAEAFIGVVYATVGYGCIRLMERLSRQRAALEVA